MKKQWTEVREGGNAFLINLLARFALLCGRTVTRIVLCPIIFYFLIRRAPERHASRQYFQRLTGKPGSWGQVIRHLFCFGVVTVDRAFLLSENLTRFNVRTYGLDELMHAVDQQRGVLIIGSHLGSFEALRVFAQLKPEVKVRAVLDPEQTPAMTTVFSSLNPELAAAIINASKDGASTALAIKEALDENAVVTLLADRARPGNPIVEADFLGAPAPFPASPWLLAAALKVPVVLCFGLYRGGKRYDLHFELFSDSLLIERSRRQAALKDIVQRFAQRLEHHTRQVPYNWFNFYDFWQRQAPALDGTAAGDNPGNPVVRGT